MYDLSDHAILNSGVSHGSPSCPVARRCPVCEGIDQAGSHFFEKSFGPNAAITVIAESIADDLGFCERHGLALSKGASHSMRIAQACSIAISRILPLLCESVVDERCQHLFFSAGRHCAACSAEEATAGRLISPIRKRWLQETNQSTDADALCWHHFQAFALRLPLEPRGQAIQQHLDVLLSTTQDLARSKGAQLTHALALLGQDPAGAPLPCCSPSDQRRTSLKEQLANPDACPICMMVGAARRSWLTGLRWAAEDEAAGCLWLFAPCCARHIADAMLLDRSDLMPLVASFALSGMAQHLRQQLVGIIQDLALAQQPKPVWYRPRRRRRGKDDAAGAAVKRFVLRCQGCEAEALALERASGNFLDLMRQARHRDHLARGHGLCLRHLAHVMPIAAPEIVRPFLVQLHAEKLRSLHAALGKRDAPPPWREALWRFRGTSLDACCGR